MEKIAVIGLGRFGRRLAKLLAQYGAEVVAIDKRRDLVEDIRDFVSRAVCMDATDEVALRSQGIDKVNIAIVGVGTAFEGAVLTTVLLKQIGVPRVISRATSVVQSQVLARVGADDIVNPEQEAADRWCSKLMTTKVIEKLELADDVSLAQVPAPESMTSKTLGELDIRKNFQVQVVAIRRTIEDIDSDGVKRTRQFVISVPMAETDVKKGDVLMVIGSDEAIKHFAES